MKYTFFIEGGDNVGKTTTIEAFKSSKYVDRVDTIRLGFEKYPTLGMTPYLNEMTKKLKRLRENINTEEDLDKYTDEQNKVINELLTDMNNAFTDIPDERYKLSERSVTICDRGFLSTYMYQFKTLCEIDKLSLKDNVTNEDNEIIHLYLFIMAYVMNMYNPCIPEASKINVVILNNNNPNKQLEIDSTETIEYKKNFDNDSELQNRINSTLATIVELLEKSDEFKIAMYNVSKIKFYHINIYNGNKRKTPDEICEELLNIINTRIKEENKI